MRPSSGFARRSILLLPLLLCLPAIASAQEIRYIYDDLNRLVGVVDKQGNAAEFVYDAVGNILQIRRFNVNASEPLAISLVRPAQGSVGTTVELFGKGFGSTPGDNLVAFNGTPSTVTAATAGSLTTTVPLGATTGPITVTRGSDSAASPGPFTVLVPLTVTPAEAKVAPGRTQQFTASGPAVWKVNGILGGTALLGMISPMGLFTAPAKIPSPNTVTVTAAAPEDPKLSSEAIVTIATRQPIPPKRLPVGDGPFAVVIADLNSDGKLDLAVSNGGRSATEISILLGNGNGTFQAERRVAVSRDLGGLAVADLNKDGVLDLAVAVGRPDGVAVLLGIGAGAFGSPQRFPAGGVPIMLAAADLNGDGRLDLAVANEISNDISVLLGAGDGTFQGPQSFAAGEFPFFVAVAHLNGDGRLDLVTANGDSNDVSVLRGNGDGTFQAQQRFPAGEHPLTVAVADLNRDGLPDLVTANFLSNDVTVLLGNGDGTFQPQRSSNAGKGSRSVAVADLNGDGRLDLVTANAEADDVAVLLGNGNGTFQAPLLFRVAGRFDPVGWPVWVALADLNSDGDLDLAVVKAFSNEVVILFGNGDGTFTPVE